MKESSVFCIVALCGLVIGKNKPHVLLAAEWGVPYTKNSMNPITLLLFTTSAPKLSPPYRSVKKIDAENLVVEE